MTHSVVTPRTGRWYTKVPREMYLLDVTTMTLVRTMIRDRSIICIQRFAIQCNLKRLTDEDDFF